MKNQSQNLPFVVGDAVLVTAGYEPEPQWLKGGAGYAGIISAIAGHRALVKLQGEIRLTSNVDQPPWKDFGTGNAVAERETHEAVGRWLVVTLGYEDAMWTDPILRLQVNLCDFSPRLGSIPDGGGVGVWVESHATMRHLRSAGH